MESYETVARRRIVNAINGKPTDDLVFDHYISVYFAIGSTIVLFVWKIAMTRFAQNANQ
jgi:hypothetical protein